MKETRTTNPSFNHQTGSSLLIRNARFHALEHQIHKHAVIEKATRNLEVELELEGSLCGFVNGLLACVEAGEFIVQYQLRYMAQPRKSIKQRTG